MAQPANACERSSSTRIVVQVEVVRRLVDEQQVAALAEHLGELHAVALAAGERADELLLVAAAEVEAATRRRVSSSCACRACSSSAPSVISCQTVFSGSRSRPVLVDVAEVHGRAEDDAAVVGLELAGDELEQRRLAGAVRADHAEDGAGRQLERDVLDDGAVAEALA